MGSLGWALIQIGTSVLTRRGVYDTDNTQTKGQPREDTARRQSSENEGERPQEKTTQLTP